MSETAEPSARLGESDGTEQPDGPMHPERAAWPESVANTERTVEPGRGANPGRPAGSAGSAEPDKGNRPPSPANPGHPQGPGRRKKPDRPDNSGRTDKSRDAFFDNAKYLAIVLVAVGHAWEPLRSDSRAVTACYMVVYAFHMPAFIVVSGYFSRGFDAGPRRIARLITGVAVPYVLLETAYTFYTRWTDGVPDRPVSLLDPLYLTWFLAALFIWRLTTPLWRLVRWPLPLALAVAALATLSPSLGSDLDMQRVLQFLPYFVLGLCLRPEHFRLVRRRRVRIAAVPVFAGALAVAYWAATRMNDAWFFHNDSAEALGAPAWYGPVMTLALFGASTVLVACFLAWVPGRRTWFTVLGAGTLYGYLLHGFVAQGSKLWGWYDPAWIYGPVGAVTVTLVAAVVMTLLCTPPVRRIFRFALEPRLDWAFRPLRTAPEGPRPVSAGAQKADMRNAVGRNAGVPNAGERGSGDRGAGVPERAARRTTV